jgi:hypothetical protein
VAGRKRERERGLLVGKRPFVRHKPKLRFGAASCCMCPSRDLQLKLRTSLVTRYVKQSLISHWPCIEPQKAILLSAVASGSRWKKRSSGEFHPFMEWLRRALMGEPKQQTGEGVMFAGSGIKLLGFTPRSRHYSLARS